MNEYIRELIGKLETTEIWDKEKKGRVMMKVYNCY